MDGLPYPGFSQIFALLYLLGALIEMSQELLQDETPQGIGNSDSFQVGM
jgi:hypothetical protein